VIKETTKQTLPAGFQTAEFLLKHGLIDQIVPRPEMRDRLRDFLLALHVKKKPRANGAKAPAAAATAG
jgi:acetyl-CoA carboxylase carboxyl transferase subunit beta